MVKYCELFWTFFKIGTFTLGGGYAMIPLMEQELVERHGWLSQEDFLDQVALSQSMPGVLAVNMATGVGYRLRGYRGAAVAIVANVMMPVVFIITLAMLYQLFKSNTHVVHFFMGVRPAAVALIAAPVFKLAKSAQVTWRTLWIPVASALLIWLMGVNPVYVILAAIVLGLLWSKIGMGTDEERTN